MVVGQHSGHTLPVRRPAAEALTPEVGTVPTHAQPTEGCPATDLPRKLRRAIRDLVLQHQRQQPRQRHSQQQLRKVCHTIVPRLYRTLLFQRTVYIEVNF